MTDKNIEMLRRTQVSDSQEQYVTAVYKELRKISEKIDFDSIEPLNDSVLIKCKITHSIIVKPGATSAGEYEWKEISKVSEQVKERNPILASKIGQRCALNLQMLINLGQAPCYVEVDPEDDTVEYHYYKCQAGQIEYTYKEK